MNTKFQKLYRGFALIDLVVMLVMLALLILILQDSLADARERAKAAKCLSNLRGAMTATVMYACDHNDAFPFVVRSKEQSGICSWAYGGKTSDDYWRTQANGLFYIPATERPLNEYLLGSKVKPDRVERSKILKRTEIRVLQCPSDHTSYQRVQDGRSKKPANVSCCDDVGTSYHYNLFALTDTNVDGWANNAAGWKRIQREVLRSCLGTDASSFVVFLEDPLEFALQHHIEVVGNHGKPSAHGVAYLDGHAEHKRMDTRRWCGPGWTVINPDWSFPRKGQPKPPIYYKAKDKRCDR